MTVGGTFIEGDGNAVTVPLVATVVNNQVAFAGGWLGITARAGDSGDYVALSLRGEAQLYVPASLSVSAGDVVCIDTTQVTGHTPNDGAYNTNPASSTNLRLLKATAAKDSRNLVTGILLVGY